MSSEVTNLILAVLPPKTYEKFLWRKIEMNLQTEEYNLLLSVEYAAKKQINILKLGPG